jgi:hypothetical protein
MEIKKIWFFAAALAAAALASWQSAGGQPSSLTYSTSCSVIDLNSADGYVTNLSPDTYQVSGPTHFTFTTANSMSRPAILYVANSIVQAGQTVRVARVKLPFVPLPEETCRYEVDSAIRKP